MGGIAGDEDPAGPPLLRVTSPEGVDGMAFEGGVVGRHVPGREQLPGSLLVVQLVERLVGEAHELPAPSPGTAGHRGRWAGRVADLQVERIEHTRWIESHDVHDQPVVEEPEVVRRGSR